MAYSKTKQYYPLVIDNTRCKLHILCKDNSPLQNHYVLIADKTGCRVEFDLRKLTLRCQEGKSLSNALDLIELQKGFINVLPVVADVISNLTWNEIHSI